MFRNSYYSLGMKNVFLRQQFLLSGHSYLPLITLIMWQSYPSKITCTMWKPLICGNPCCSTVYYNTTQLEFLPGENFWQSHHLLLLVKWNQKYIFQILAKDMLISLQTRAAWTHNSIEHNTVGFTLAWDWRTHNIIIAGTQYCWFHPTSASMRLKQ